MDKVQVRFEVSTKTSAEVSYLSKCLSISKKETYALIVDQFLFERPLDKAYVNLRQALIIQLTSPPDDEPDDVPF